MRVMRVFPYMHVHVDMRRRCMHMLIYAYVLIHTHVHVRHVHDKNPFETRLYALVMRKVNVVIVSKEHACSKTQTTKSTKTRFHIIWSKKKKKTCSSPVCKFHRTTLPRSVAAYSTPFALTRCLILAPP
jgi:hypothetical protein